MKALTSLVVLITTLIMINGLTAEQITILHINDHHSHLKPDKRMSLMLDGKSTRVRSGGMPAVVAKIKELEATNNNVINYMLGTQFQDHYFLLYSRVRQTQHL